MLPGDWVEVLPTSSVLATLDADGTLDGLPFMPEMLPYCGRRFRVRMRAERTCVHPPQIPFRRLKNCVVLEGLRCEGESHGRCQLGCMFLWKEEWLTRVDGPHANEPKPAGPWPTLPVTRPGAPELFLCQATELTKATTPGDPLWSPGQYARFVADGTFTPIELVGMFARMGQRLANKTVRAIAGSTPQAQAPEDHLALEPGEWVEVRSEDEIRSTLDGNGTYRGLHYTGEMSAHCGKRLKVSKRVERIIAEETGKMRFVRDTVILEGAYCDRYLGCARLMPFLWREAWLKRVEAIDSPSPDAEPRRASGAK